MPKKVHCYYMAVAQHRICRFLSPIPPPRLKGLKQRKVHFSRKTVATKISQNRILAVPESSRKKIG